MTTTTTNLHHQHANPHSKALSNSYSRRRKFVFCFVLFLACAGLFELRFLEKEKKWTPSPVNNRVALHLGAGAGAAGAADDDGAFRRRDDAARRVQDTDHEDYARDNNRDARRRRRRRRRVSEPKKELSYEEEEQLRKQRMEERMAGGKDVRESNDKSQPNHQEHEKLRVEHVDSLNKSSIVFAAFASAGFHEFMLNWYAHTQKLNIGNVIVAAFDAETEKVCKENNIPYLGDEELRYTHGVVATGGQPLHDQNAKVTMVGKAFQQIGALKASFLLRLMQKGFRVLVSDCDTAWMRDPREWFATNEMAKYVDMAVSTDCLSYKNEEKVRGCWHDQFNTGILFLNPTEKTKGFLKDWQVALETTTHKFEHDQDIFNRLLREGAGLRPPQRLDEIDVENRKEGAERHELHVALASKDLKLGALPLTLFTSGHVFFIQQTHLHLNVEPFVVHTTYQFSQARGKRQRLREHQLWLIDAQEYHDEGNFITTSEKPPQELLSIGIENHLKLASWYRLVLRNLFAYAEILNRIPILPEFSCLCDRYWGNVLPQCYIPGADIHPPYNKCPMDHVTNLPNLERAGLNFREYSFLTNEQTSDKIKQSVETVSLSRQFPTDEEIRDQLGRKTDKRVLVLETASKSFCTFKDESKSKAFDSKMQTGLEAESHFCKHGGSTGRVCEIGFTKPKGVSQNRDCDRMRSEDFDFEKFYDKLWEHKE